MKNLLIMFLLLPLLGCSSQQISERDEKGTTCLKSNDSENIPCIPVRLYLDPVRFHRLNHVEKEIKPDMPDLP